MKKTFTYFYLLTRITSFTYGVHLSGFFIVVKIMWYSILQKGVNHLRKYLWLYNVYTIPGVNIPVFTSACTH